MLCHSGCCLFIQGVHEHLKHYLPGIFPIILGLGNTSLALVFARILKAELLIKDSRTSLSLKRWTERTILSMICVETKRSSIPYSRASLGLKVCHPVEHWQWPQAMASCGFWQLLWGVTPLHHVRSSSILQEGPALWNPLSTSGKQPFQSFPSANRMHIFHIPVTCPWEWSRFCPILSISLNSTAPTLSLPFKKAYWNTNE